MDGRIWKFTIEWVNLGKQKRMEADDPSGIVKSTRNAKLNCLIPQTDESAIRIHV